jgi:hypothetical protein
MTMLRQSMGTVAAERRVIVVTIVVVIGVRTMSRTLDVHGERLVGRTTRPMIAAAVVVVAVVRSIGGISPVRTLLLSLLLLLRLMMIVSMIVVIVIVIVIVIVDSDVDVEGRRMLWRLLWWFSRMLDEGEDGHMRCGGRDAAVRRRR